VTLPGVGASVLLRAPYGNDDAWTAAVSACTEETDDGFVAHLIPVQDPALVGLTAEQSVALWPDQLYRTSAFVYLPECEDGSERRLLAVDLHRPSSRPRFWITARAVVSVENNLSLATSTSPNSPTASTATASSGASEPTPGRRPRLVPRWVPHLVRHGVERRVWLMMNARSSAAVGLPYASTSTIV